MKILGLDSSGLVAGAAVVENGTLLAEYSTNYQKTHSQTLLPMLEQMGRMIELDFDTLDAVAVASGPGSFTGLRIGSATAKGLGFALDKPLVEVPTLEGLAWNLWGVSDLVCPLMDARRNQVYTAVYRFTPAGEGFLLESCLPQAAMDVEELIQKLNGFSQPVQLLGDGAPVYGKLLREKLRAPFRFAPAHVNRQRAASVASLGEVYFTSRQRVDAASHKPEYLRKSQAEREALEKRREGYGNHGEEAERGRH